MINDTILTYLTDFIQRMQLKKSKIYSVSRTIHNTKLTGRQKISKLVSSGVLSHESLKY